MGHLWIKVFMAIDNVSALVLVVLCHVTCAMLQAFQTVVSLPLVLCESLLTVFCFFPLLLDLAV
jgi:hypothetical protein